MHNNIMAAGSRDRPPMLATGRYAQWRSRFLRYIDTRPNGDALRKCILKGPYTSTIVTTPAVPATEDSPAVPEQTTVETVMNMTPENRAHFESEKEAIHLILTGIGDEIYSTVDACQTAQEMWEAIESKATTRIFQLILFIIDSGCTKHMTAIYHSAEQYFVEIYLKFSIERVYYVEGLNHNLFSVGQFCDANLKVAFRKSTCFVRDLQGNNLLTGNRGTDLYTISLQETTSSAPICLMAKASPTQAWLWHRRLSHLNFDYINLLFKKDVVIGLPKLKYVKDQLCSSCEVSKAKRSSFKSKTVPSSKGRLNLLHMDLCGPMRVASINGKKYILDETPEVLKDFLTMIQRNLQALVISVRTDRGTEFLNKTLNAFFKEEGIEHQTSTPRTPEQNGVVERRNRTLVRRSKSLTAS
ncbi:retrovirus-related pol polyprotein from transposon TNT 1-94 [Tanacetum coccineum]